jgi:hypothetical protein
VHLALGRVYERLGGWRVSFDWLAFASGVVCGVGGLVALLSLPEKRKAPVNAEKSWTDGAGFKTIVLSVGHSSVSVSYMYQSQFGHGMWRQEASWSVQRCAKDAGWPLSKMRDYLGLPDEAVLQETGLTMGEWLAAKEDNRGA